MQITAAVVSEKFGKFVIDTVELCDPRPDEVVVKIVASGICQTDLHARDGYFTIPYPAVYGHEGAGIVERVGASVRKVAPGDHVVISFPWCGTCPSCARQQPAYCVHSIRLKMSGTRDDGSTLMQKDGAPVYSAFFQQSSFGTRAIAQEKFVVKVRKDAPLEMLGPFGCGVQTGAGAVLNVMKPAKGDSFVVFGVGAVGMSGLMAAKIAGCNPIIAVDVHDNRLALARELGATHTINHAGKDKVVSQIHATVPGGVRFSLETSAIPGVLREAVDILAPLGTCVLVGSARFGTEAAIDMPVIQDGRVLRGVMQGDSRPDEFIPELIDLMMDGKLPIGRMVRAYELADINQAAADTLTGTTIKPIIRMP